MKKILFIVLLILVGAFFIFRGGEEGPFIGEDIRILSYTHDGEQGEVASVHVPFLKTSDNVKFVTISLDINGDSLFTEDEQIVTNTPVNTQENWSNGYYFVVPENLADITSAKIVLGDEEKIAEVLHETFETGALLDLSTVTNPEESMKGIGLAQTYAQSGANVSQTGVPDISQKPGECAPTTATNGLISLINRNNKDDSNQPGTQNEIIEELKNDMQWTRADGVLPDNFVSGKNTWAERHGYPIETRKVGDTHGRNTIEEIKGTLQNGGAVELRIKFGDPSTGKAVGGHIVTVTGIHETNGRTTIDINDPATPEGTETVEVSGNQITNYGPFNGWTLISWGFTQTWTDIDDMADTEIDTEMVELDLVGPDGLKIKVGEDADIKEEPKEMSFEEVGKLTPDQLRALGKLKIPVLVLGGSKFPFPQAQFGAIWGPDECEEFHYHGASGFTLDLKTIPEKDPVCGFGNDIKIIEVTGEEMIQWFHNKP